MTFFVGRHVDQGYLASGKLDAAGLIRRVHDFEQRAKGGERSTQERRWGVNLRWYAGEPFYRINAQGDVLAIDPDARKNYVHINIVLPRVKTLVGHMGYAPKFEARHAVSLDPEDHLRARAAADVANHACRAGELPKALREVQTMNHVFGHAWVKVGWDPERGRVRPQMGQVPCPSCSPGEGQPGVGAIMGVDGKAAPCPTCATQGVLMGPPDLEQRGTGYVDDVVGEKPEGDVFFDAIPPWEIFTDPEARDLFAVRELLHCRDMSRAAAFALFGESAGIDEKDFKDDGGYLHSIDSFGGRVGPLVAPGNRQYVTVKEHYERPSQMFPRGLYAVVVAGDLLCGGPLPYAHLKIPYVPVRCHVIPGHAYPRSTVDNLLPIAQALNDHMNDARLATRQRIAFRMLAAEGSGFRLSDEPGVVLFTPQRGVAAPQPIPTDGGINNALEMINRFEKQADEVSFANGVMRGDAGPNVDSARYASFLEERSVNPVRDVIEDNAESYQQIGRLGLETLKLFYHDGRLIQTFGGNGQAAYRQFKMENVGGVDDVVLTSTRDVGRSLAARRAELIEAKKNGILDDPFALKLSEFATDPMVQQQQREHESLAVIENERVRERALNGAGRPMQRPMPFQRHDIHLDIHQSLYTELTETLGEDHPQVQELFQHMMETLQLQSDEAVRAQAMAQESARRLGLVNGANPGAQSTPTATAAAALPPTDPTTPPGGPPESQPILNQVDAGMQQVDQQIQGAVQ